MTSQSKTFIEVPVIEGARTTMPVDEAKRLAASEIKISIADETDAYRIAEGIYACFTQESIDKMEPPHLQPSMSTRLYLMARRIQPTLSQPHMHWIKATHLPTNTIIGAAAWASPSLPVHNIFRKSAFTFYGWKEKLNLTDADIDALYANVDDEVWSGTHAKNDEIRKEVVPEPHWYLASLITWPEWQGRGVGRRLLDWAIEKADREGTPMCLEASAMSRAVYLHVGFVQQGEKTYVRRGPRGVEGKEGGVGEKTVVGDRVDRAGKGDGGTPGDRAGVVMTE